MKLVVLDRDGVINQDSPDYIRCAADWQALPGSVEAIAALSQNGWKVAVATNQSGVGRGLFGYQELAAIHRKMLAAVTLAGGRIDGIFFCPHAPDDNCNCRKPAPGLYAEISRFFGMDLGGVWSVGDSGRDLEAAIAGGARPALVRTGNGETTEKRLGADACIPVFDNLADFVSKLLKN